jgi:hypothetical protein
MIPTGEFGLHYDAKRRCQAIKSNTIFTNFRKEKKQHGGAGGKGKWNEVDDGTLE